MQPPQRGVAILVPMTRKASAAAHSREVLGAGLLAALRAVCGESTSQLLPRPWVARERLSLGCRDSRVKGKGRAGALDTMSEPRLGESEGDIAYPSGKSIPSRGNSKCGAPAS